MKPAKHGRDHAPGGEDPIPTTGPISALAQAFARSQTCTGNMPLDFDSFYRNHEAYGYSDVTSGRARYVTLSRAGWYLYHGVIFWDTDWTAGDFPYIEPSAEVGGSATTLIGVSGIDWDDTQGIIYGQQFIASEMDHHSLAATVLFNFDPAAVGFSSIGVGVNVRSGSTRTKAFGGHIALTWLGDALEEVTIT